MATTTAAAQRDLMVTTIKALIPTVMAQTRYTHHDENGDFRLFAMAKPIAAFRRVSIRDLGPVQGPAVVDTVQAWNETVFEVVVGYPVDFRYGLQALLDLDDVLWADLNQIDDAVGTRGFATFGDAVVTLIEKTQERDAGPVRFGVLRFKVEFWRASS